MSPSEVMVEGMLQPDGTLILDRKPPLPSGRVTVLLRQAPNQAPVNETWWQSLQRSRRELEAAGSNFMNDAEMDAHIDWLREGDLIDDMLQQANYKPGAEPR